MSYIPIQLEFGTNQDKHQDIISKQKSVERALLCCTNAALAKKQL
jgi:hypothetical protein